LPKSSFPLEVCPFLPLLVIFALTLLSVVAEPSAPISPFPVPYGLHGRFFTPDQIASQRPNIPTLTTDISLPPAPALSDALYPVDTVLEAELKDFDLLDPPRESKATAAAKSASELIRSTLLGLGLVSPTTA
jgi:hypothetical protein